MPVAVVFAPGTVPGDLPRPLPFRDVQEMEISVNGERRPPAVPTPALLWLSPPFQLPLSHPSLLGGIVLTRSGPQQLLSLHPKPTFSCMILS